MNVWLKVILICTALFPYVLLLGVIVGRWLERNSETLTEEEEDALINELLKIRAEERAKQFERMELDWHDAEANTRQYGEN